MNVHVIRQIIGIGTCSLLITVFLASLSFSQVTQYSGDEDGLKKLAMDVNGNRDLLLQLKPSKTDVKTLTSSSESAEELQSYLDNLFTSIPAGGIAGKSGQTEVKIESAAIADVKSGQDRVMPGGYTNTAGHYGDGYRIYSISYTQPGEDLGMRFDAFIFVNNHWVFAPKMWRAFARQKPPAVSNESPQNIDGMQLLSRRIGSWSEEITIKFPATNRTAKVIRNLNVKPILGGKYLEMISADEKFEARVQVFFEGSNSLFFMNSIDTSGDTSFWRGRATAENQISFVGDFSDGRKGSVTWDLTNDDSHRWNGKVTLPNGQIFVEVSGLAKRK